MKKLLLVALLTLGAVFSPLASSVFAEGEDSSAYITGDNAPRLSVSPATASVILKQGATVDYTLVVNNEEDDSLDITVYAAPFSIQNENYDADFEKETNRTQLSRWIKFVNDDGSVVDTYKATIPANTKSNVTYRITIPEEIPAGGQYASIFVQTGDTAKPLDTSGITAVSRVGVIIYGRSNGETDESAEITEANIPTFLLNGPVTASALVKNLGNTDIEVNYSFIVTSIVGAELYYDEGKEPIIPDASRRMKETWNNTQPMGIFHVTYRIETLDQVYETSKLVIILPIYMILLAIFILTLLIIWIIILIRKRRERKSRLVV
ncbi:hypothetical protein IKF94_03825 [Candidatus Saccharibacteria bacterium]|nr:hypothetical protein [Candidatus Saccharibacteria bacterium]